VKWVLRVRKAFGTLMDMSSADAEDARGHRLLNLLLLGATAATLLMLVAVLVAAAAREQVESVEVSRLSFGIVVTLFGVASITMLRRYRSTEVPTSLLLLFLAAVALSDLPIQVVDGRSLALHAIPILVASVLLRPWASFVLAALSCLMILVIGWTVQPFGNIPAMAAFFVLILVAWLSTRSLKGALEDARLANRRLQDSEARYRDLFDGVPVGLYRTTPSGRFLNANLALVEMLGYPDRESLLAIRAGELYVHAGDRKRWLAMLERDGLARDYETQVRRHDGSVIDVHCSARVGRDGDGRVEYYEGSLEDITERKRAELSLRALNEGALAIERSMTPQEIFSAAAQEFKKLGLSCAVLLADESQEKLFLNYLSYEPRLIQAAQKLTGLQPEGFAIPVELVRPYVKAIREKKTTFVSNTVEIVEHVLPEPVKKLASPLAQMLKIAKSISAPLIVGDRVVGVFSVQSDELTEADVPAITAFAHQMAAAWRKAQLMLDLRKSLKDLTDTQAQLLQARKLESIGRLAGGIAHDFSNLLTVMIGQAQLGLNKVESSHRLYKHLAEIEKAAQRAAGLTRRLLAFSRRQILQKRVLDLNELISEFSIMLVRVIGEDIDLELDLAPQLEPVLVDGNAVEQVLMNLALNARDAMPEGGALRISTSQVSVDEAYSQSHVEATPGDYVRLTVSDTGIGIDPAILDHLFEPFYTTKEPGKGTGLGLAMIYGLVRQHDGWIEVESVKGEGATFHVHLPVHRGAVKEKVEGTKALALPTGEGTVLLAEDEQEVQEFGRSVLEGLGYTVLAAADGQEAVELFTANRDGVDLIVLDAVMPRVSGSKAYGVIRALRPDVPVLFITGYSEEMAGLSSEWGTEMHILRKPFGPAELGRKVREVLDEARAALAG
jgi:PAS domain S-box-containing protein